MTRTAAREYAALTEAMRDTIPPCSGDPLFTLDDPADIEIAYMHRICAGCPLRRECAAYANAARVTAGFWASKQYPPKKGRKK